MTLTKLSICAVVIGFGIGIACLLALDQPRSSDLGKSQFEAAAILPGQLPSGSAQDIIETATTPPSIEPETMLPNGREDYAETFGRLLEMENQSERQQGLTEWLNRWMAYDPLAAVRRVAQLEPSPTRADLLDEALRIWCRLDTPAALNWAEQLSGDDRELAMTRVSLELAVTDPQRALALATERPGEASASMVEDMVGRWAASDYLSALEWVSRETNGVARDACLARIAFTGANRDPVGSAWLVVERMSPGPAQEEAIICVVHQWASKDIDAAKAWVERFSEGTMRTRALAEIALLATVRSN